MTNYAGRYAELYDSFYADKPYSDEARFVHELIAEFGSGQTRTVLELACGTGRHALELEKFGYEITATDRSVDMLAIARHRAAENGSKINFVVADMQHLGGVAKDFDAAICLFDSIGYLQTDQALLDALGQINKHLRPSGLFIFEFWHASAMLKDYSPTRVRKLKTDDSEIVRTSTTTLDRTNRLANVVYTVEETRRDRAPFRLCETHTNRFFSVDEMRDLISRANLAALKFFAGFDATAPITDETWHIVAVARKK